MPVMVPNQPIEVRTPTLLVENALAAGRHRFALVVVDQRGESKADIIEIEVRRGRVPPPIGPIGAIDPIVRPLSPRRRGGSNPR
jgi:hypothetical protein